MPSATAIPVLDPFGVVGDPQLPTLEAALDPRSARSGLRRALETFAGGRRIELRAIRVVRYKPRRRCLVEYEVDVAFARGSETVTLLGKVQRGRYGKSGYRLLEALWHAGFHATAADGISVPEPVGTVPALRMWLQRRVPGVPAAELLARPGAAELSARVAAAAHKVHRSGVPTERRHGMADELRILEGCLAQVVERSPARAERTARLLAACRRLAERTPAPVPTGVHRDFYADQVVVDGERLTLIDFDLYCVGDPALDIGNFSGHLAEQGLREHDDPRALADAEDALEERFVELSGEGVRPAVRAYAALTLARHVFLSGELPGRGHLTDALLDLAEARVDAARGARVR